jgi:aryl-alcohol dehydrogenase-like predicted oxidoreductase
MEKRALGNTGVELSRACLGAMLMGTRMGPEESYRTLDLYAERGGNFIDTANCYAWWVGKGEYVGDESENAIGAWMAERRNRNSVFLATKCGGRIPDSRGIRDASGTPRWAEVPAAYEGASRLTVARALEGSLKRLGTDHVDLYYVHVDDRRAPLEETLETLNALVASGKVRYIGYSNVRTWRLERIRALCERNGWASPVAVQQEFSYLRPAPGVDMVGHANDELFDWLDANPGVDLVAYSPLLKGIFASEEKRRAYYNWPLYDTEDTAARLARLSALSKKTGIDGNSLVLAWMLASEPSVFPVLGGSAFEHYRENLDACEIKLDGETIAYLEGSAPFPS